MSAIVSADRVRDALHYDPRTGVFTWLLKTTNSVHVGSTAGCLHHSGYLQITIDGRIYLAHRLAWLWVHGRWPIEHIDHINGRKDDNRLLNLREATISENLQNRRAAKSNSKSGFLGVCWSKKGNKWQAQIGISGKVIYLGYFPTAELAHAAYIKAKRELHPACTI